MVEWFLLSGNYRVSSLTNNGVFCGEFGEVGSFWIRDQVCSGAKVCGMSQECTRLRCCSMAGEDRSKRWQGMCWRLYEMDPGLRGVLMCGCRELQGRVESKQILGI